MKNETSFPTRRSLLGQAVGAVGIASYWRRRRGGRGGPRVRESRSTSAGSYLQRDVAGAQQPGFADASWKDVDLPHDFRHRRARQRECAGQGGKAAILAHRYRLVPETLHGSRILQRQKGFHRSSTLRIFKLSEVWDQRSGTWANGRTGTSVSTTI